MKIRVRNMVLKDLERVVQIHTKAFDKFFLTCLGKKFLYDLYRNFINDEYSICLVAENNSYIKGFIVGNIRPVSLFKKMLLHEGYLFFLHSLKALARNPFLVSKKLFYALQYRGDLPEGFKKPSLLSSIGVDPDESQKGIGSILLNEFCKKAFMKNADVIYLTTDNQNNDPVNEFYKKNGFQLESIIEKNRGRLMNRYIKLPESKN